MAKNKRVSFEIKYLTNDEKWILRYKVGGVSQEAPRYESLDEAICGVGGFIRYNDIRQDNVPVNIILKNGKA